MAKKVMDQLVAYGEMRRGQLGIKIVNLSPEMAKAHGIGIRQGALIAAVTVNSPAAHAGLEPGDVITTINGEKVHGAADVRNKIGLLPVGCTVELDVLREATAMHVTARLAAAPSVRLTVPADVAALAGVVLGSIDPNSSLYGLVEGAMVLEVKKGSPAAGAGLLVGDVVLGVDQTPVQSPDDAIAAARKAEGKLLLHVVRDSNLLLVVIG
jgi:S1-C subfamily serine protease